MYSFIYFINFINSRNACIGGGISHPSTSSTPLINLIYIVSHVEAIPTSPRSLCLKIMMIIAPSLIRSDDLTTALLSRSRSRSQDLIQIHVNPDSQSLPYASLSLHVYSFFLPFFRPSLLSVSSLVEHELVWVAKPWFIAQSPGNDTPPIMVHLSILSGKTTCVTVGSYIRARLII